MKRLLTFIYGLLILSMAIACFHQFKKTENWYCWIYFITFISLVYNGMEKLKKAIED